MISTIRILAFVLATALAVFAEPYWIAYDGNDFPEKVGWTRTHGAEGALRTLVDGTLVIDSRRSNAIVDFYNAQRAINPSPGETFVMRWRLRVDEVLPTYPVDVGVSVFSDKFRAVAFEFGEDHLSSVFEPGVKAPIAPSLFHEYEFRSGDMSFYELFVDGEVALSGTFQPVFNASKVGWGDVIQGARSQSTWDSFEFGVIPEPSALSFLLLACVPLSRTRRGEVV